MDVLPSQVFSPAGLPELFSAWARFPDAVPFAGGTTLLRSRGQRVPGIPRNILALDRLEELRKITRTERYLEIGAMVTLSEIIQLGKIVPEALSRCLENIAGPSIRNLATIGGNLCNPSRRLDAAAPMAALDAHYELRTSAQTRWISASRFSSLPGSPALGNQELLTRIRVPLDQWNYSLFRKFASSGNQAGGVIVFLMRNQKNILTDIRIVFSGEILVQDRNAENFLVGRQMPLDRRDALNFIDRWRGCLAGLEKPDDLTKAEILNFIESGISVITE